MAKNLLVINVDIRETRVALIENGIIAELHLERESSQGTLGNVYLGKVSRVLPGMQAAFIDVGLERAAFLHVEDLIRPDDFEAYLAGHRRALDEDRTPGPTPEHAPQAPLPSPHMASEPGVERPERVPESDERATDPREDEDDADALHTAAAEAEEAERLQASDEGHAENGHDHHHHHEHEHHEGDLAASDAHADEAHEAEEASDEASDPDETPIGDDAAEADSADAIEASADVVVHEAIVADASGLVVAVEAEAVPGVGEPDVGMPRPRSRRSRNGRVRRSGRTADRKPVVDAAAAAPAPAQEPREQGGGRGGQGRGRGGQGRNDGRGGQGRNDGRGGQGRNDGRGGRQGGRDSAQKKGGDGMRVSRQTPIREVVREGQEVIVQISKEPIGTKGARVTSHVTLPGRYVVYLPTVDHVGISKRIGSDKERSRLREAMDAMKPPQGGLIVRTVAEGLTKKQLKADIGYLVRLWGEIIKKRENAGRPPACLYTELDLILKTARDLFTDDIEKIVIDSREEYVRLTKFVEMFMPERVDAVELYEGEEPIFDAYGIEDEIQRAQSRKVPLPSGGHLIIDQAEALTAIDVNTGRYVGKGSKDLEETILATNLEAVEEIAYQLRFRNIGGLIILDLIDMDRAQNREKVRRRLEDLLANDKAKTTLNRISDLGLIEMTRKRTRESLGRTVLEPCFYCDGTGQLQSKQTIAYEILRQMRRERRNLPGYSIVVNAHPAVVDYMRLEERVAVQEAERIFQRRIELVPRKEYHLEQFDLQGK